MPTEKNWNAPDVNRPHFATGTTARDQMKELIWYIKAFLLGQVGGSTLGLWQMVACSDGIRAAFDGTDLLGTTTYDPTKINKGLPAVNGNYGATVTATGGTLPAGTYFYTFFPVNDNGVFGNPWLEQRAITTGTTSKVTLDITPYGTQFAGGADHYRVYRGPASGGLNTYWDLAPGVSVFVDTGAPGTAGVPPSPTGGTAVGTVFPVAGMTTATYLTQYTGRTWYILKSVPITSGNVTSTPFYLIVDWLNDNSYYDYRPFIYIAKTPPAPLSATGAYWDRPPFVDQVLLGGIQLNNNGTGSPKFCGFLADDGSFWFFISYNGNGYVAGYLAYHVLADCWDNDQFPVVLGYGWYQSTFGALANAIVSTWVTRNNANNTGCTGGMIWPKGTLDPPRDVLNTGDAGKNTYYTLITQFGITQANLYSTKGRFQDTVICVPGANINGDVFPAAGAPTDQCLGYLRFPLKGAAVTL